MSNVEIIIKAIGSEKVKRELSNIKRSFNDLSKSINHLKEKWVELLAGAYSLKKAFDFTTETTRFYQSFQAFESMVQSMGRDAAAEFERLKEAAGGLIDNESLIEAANRAMSLGIPIQNLADLMLIARAKARDMGITITQAFNDIVTGVGRASPMIIDNLGITLKIGEATEEYAKSIGKSVKELTSQEQKLAILRAVLKSGREALSRYDLEQKTLNERFQEFRVRIENLKIVFGELLIRLGAGLMGVFQGAAGVALKLSSAIFSLIKGISWLTDRVGLTKNAFQEWKINAEAASKAATELFSQAKDSFELMLSSRKKLRESLGGGLKISNVSKFEGNQTDKEKKDLQKRLEEETKIIQQKFDDWYKAREWLTNRINKLTLSEFDYQRTKLLEEYQERAKILGWTEELYSALKLDLAKLEEQQTAKEKAELQKRLEEDARAIQQRFDQWYEQNKERLAQLTKELKGYWGNFKEGIQDTVRSWGDAFDQMKQIGRDTAQATQRAFSDFFFDVFTGKLKDIGDTFKSLLNSILRSVSNVMSTQITTSLFKELGLVKSHQGGLVMHSGGYVVPRFHFGGLASDEVPAILQRGEYVVSRRGVEALDRINTGQIGAIPNIIVNVENKSSLPLKAEQKSINFNGKDVVISWILEDYHQFGPMYHLIKNRK